MTKLRDDLRDEYGVDTTFGSDDATVSGDITHSGAVVRVGNTTLTGIVDVTGNTDLGGTLDVTGDTTITGTLSHSGGKVIGLTIVTTATYTVLPTDNLLHVTYTGAVTITIPTALVVTGRVLEIKAANITSLNPITVQTEGSELIEGNATTVMYNDYGKITLYSDGTNWFLGQAFGQQTYPNVYAYVSTPGDTTVTVADTFYPIVATFTNPHVDGFTIGASGITYDLAETRSFEIDWSGTFAVDNANRTIHVGIAVNGETLDYTSPTIMGIFFRYATDPLCFSGTAVLDLTQGDTVTLEVTSANSADVITTTYFNTTIRPFER